MNRSIFLVFFLVFFYSCNSKSEKQSEERDVEIVDVKSLERKKSDTLQEPNYIAIFDEKTEKATTLTISEISIVKNQLENGVNKYNADLKIKLDKWNKEEGMIKWKFDNEKIDLRYYFRQYIVSTDKNGDKIVRVFCFCSYPSFWRNEILQVNDGGSCFLDAKINLSKGKIEYFGTHGEA